MFAHSNKAQIIYILGLQIFCAMYKYFRALDIFPRILIYMWGILPRSDSHTLEDKNFNLWAACANQGMLTRQTLCRFSNPTLLCHSRVWNRAPSVLRPADLAITSCTPDGWKYPLRIKLDLFERPTMQGEDLHGKCWRMIFVQWGEGWKHNMSHKFSP